MFCLAVIHFEQSLSGNPSKQLLCSEAFCYQTQNPRQSPFIYYWKRILKSQYLTKLDITWAKMTTLVNVADDAQQLIFFYREVNSLGNSKAIKHADSFLSLISFTWYHWSQGKNFHWPCLPLLVTTKTHAMFRVLTYFCAFGWFRAQSFYFSSELFGLVYSVQIPKSTGLFSKGTPEFKVICYLLINVCINLTKCTYWWICVRI